MSQDAQPAGSGLGSAEFSGAKFAGAEDVLVLDEFALPVWEPTGQPQVDAALDLIAGLDADDLSAHAAVFDDVHQRLRQVLADLDG